MCRLEHPSVVDFDCYHLSPGFTKSWRRESLCACVSKSGARSLLFAVWLAMSFLVAATANALGMLSVSSDLSQEGFLTISWQKVPSASNTNELQVGGDSEFHDLVRVVPLNVQVVEKSQLHISGLTDGIYFARLVTNGGEPLTDVARFEVRHRELGTALLIFFVGAALFIALIVVVLRFAATEQ